ncbi:MAG: hypothetical protein WCS17_11980 [Prevotella sp.]
MSDKVIGSVIVRQTKSGDQLSFRFETDKAIWQGYNTETGSVVPDWSVAANQPTITPKAFSSRIGADVSKIGNGTWSYNGTIITFDSSTGISTNFSGAFKMNFDTDAITIVNNIASSGNQNNDLLSYNNNWDNGYAESASGQIEIVIDKVGSTPYNGIVNLSTNTLNETNGVVSCIATAVLMRGTTTLSSGFTVKWYKRGSSTVLGTDTSLTIDRSMTAGKEVFYCEFYVDVVLQSVYYFSVYDMSDPAQLVFELKTTNDTTSPTANVQYYVKLVQSGTGAQIASATFAVAFYNSRRRAITGGDSGLDTSGTLTVTYSDGEMIDSIDGIKNGAIEAEITANY